MDKKVAEALVEASEDWQVCDEPLHLRKAYSGRCMYGKTTAAVVGMPCDFNSALIRCVTDIINECDPDAGDDMYALADEVEKFMTAALRVSTDNMGRDDLVWY
jgi:hypothetical protein